MKRHPFIKYAEALVRVESKLASTDQILPEHLSKEIEVGLEYFRVRPKQLFEGKTQVSYEQVREEKGDTSSGVFLSPGIISSDKETRHVWKASHALLGDLNNENIDLGKASSINMSIAPTSGEFTKFAIPNKGKSASVSRGKPKESLLIVSLSTITTLTPWKPSLRSGNDNCCIIPDIPMSEMMEFIIIFQRMLLSRTGELMVGNVSTEETGKGKKKVRNYKPYRPLIFKGSFPNPPKSSALGGIALLAAIGEFAKESKVSTSAKNVLESLKDVPMYIIKYGGATTFTYNHHVVDLAKEGKLSEIVDSIYYTKLHGEGVRTTKSTEYQKFDLFSSRFLQLFNRSAFRDFLAFRAEYPTVLEILFMTYFKKVEMIDANIVKSARDLGRWLNQVAYFTAKREVNNSNDWEEIRKVKAKILVELESSTFSAKTGDALVAQVITRAGRLSNMSAPNGASLFIEKTCTGELPLDSAKNLLMAFSRLRSNNEKKDQISKKSEGKESEDSSKDLSHI